MRWSFMKDLHLKCNTCKVKITVSPDDQISLFFVQNYGQLDKVTGRVFELSCPLCPGVLEKINENDIVPKHQNVPKQDSFKSNQPKHPDKQLK
jgi:hypothetical protein